MTDQHSRTTSPAATGAVFPAMADLLPHGPDAVLLDAVIAHDAQTTVCRVDPAASRLYLDEDGQVPAYVALEYMAQAVAAHGGLLDREQGRPARPGLFLGTRRLRLSTARLAADEPLEVVATHVRGAGPLLAFDCCIRRPGRPRDTPTAQDEAMVSATLTVYLLESFEALLRDFDGEGPAQTDKMDKREDRAAGARLSGPTD